METVVALVLKLSIEVMEDVFCRVQGWFGVTELHWLEAKCEGNVFYSHSCVTVDFHINQQQPKEKTGIAVDSGYILCVKEKHFYAYSM